MRNITLVLFALLICSCSSGGSSQGTTIPIGPDVPTIPDVNVTTLVDAWAVINDAGDQFKVTVRFYNPGAASTVTVEWNDALFIGGENTDEWITTAETGWNEIVIPMSTTNGPVDRVWPVSMLYVDVFIGRDLVTVWPMGGAT